MCLRVPEEMARHQQRGRIFLHGCEFCSRKGREEGLVLAVLKDGHVAVHQQGGRHLSDDGCSAQQVLCLATGTVQQVQSLDPVVAPVLLCSNWDFEADSQHTGFLQPQGKASSWAAHRSLLHQLSTCSTLIAPFARFVLY